MVEGSVECSGKPVKANDHGTEAFSRFAGGYFHHEKPKKRARVSSASMSRG